MVSSIVKFINKETSLQKAENYDLKLDETGPMAFIGLVNARGWMCGRNELVEALWSEMHKRRTFI